MLNIILRTTPATHTMDVPIRVFKKIISQVRTNHAGDAGDECFIYQYDLLIIAIKNRSTHEIGLNPSEKGFDHRDLP